MINNRKKVKDYSIAPGTVAEDLVNAIKVKYSYFTSIQEAETFIDNLEEK